MATKKAEAQRERWNRAVVAVLAATRRDKDVSQEALADKRKIMVAEGVGHKVTDEHRRAALEWLNTHTDPMIRFFGVRLAAVTLAGAPAGLIALLPDCLGLA